MTPARFRTALLAAPRLPAPDAALLAAFAAGRDEAAFAELVRRHARLVRGAARRVLGDPAGADDVAQAAFLVLARKAGERGWGPTVGPWLYRVAVRLAVKAKARAARRPSPLPAEVPAPPADPAAGLSWAEARSALDDGLSRLPERLRGPLVLCYLDGMTRDEAAAALGCSPDALKGRLERGRAKLRAYLSDKGLSLAAALAGVAASDAGGRAAFAAATARAAAGGPVPAGVAGLLTGGVGWAWTTAAGLVVAAGVCVAGLSGGPHPADPPAGPPPRVAEAPAPKVDALGDPLPPGAVARLGSNRLHHGENVRRIAVSPDGRHVLSQGNRTWKLWEVDTGRELPVAAGKYAPDAVLAGGPAGRGLAVVAQAEAGWVLANALTGATLLDMPGLRYKPGPITGPGEYPSGPAVRPDGKAVAFAQYDFPAPPGVEPLPAVKVWEAGRPGPDVLTAGRQASRLLYSPDGRRLAVHYEPDYGTEVWDPAGRKLLLRVPDADRSLGQSFAFSHDGRQFAKEQGGGNKVQFWDLDTGKESPPLTWDKAREYRWVLALSPDGKTAVTAADQRAFRVWDLTTRTAVRDLPCHSWAAVDVGWTPDGKRMVTAEGDDLYVRDAATGKLVVNYGHTYTIYRVAWSPDGSRVTTRSGYTDTRPRVWDATTGRPLPSEPPAAGIPPGATLDPQAGRAYTVENRKVVRAWDAATGRELARFEPADGPVDAVRVSRDGGTLAAVGAASVHVWDLARNRSVLSVPHRLTQPDQVWLSADGRRVVASGQLPPGGGRTRDYEAVCWEVPSGAAVAQPATGLARPEDLSADGRFLLAGTSRTGKADGRVELWDLDAGGRPRVLAARGGDDLDAKDVMFARFAPDGRTAAVGFRAPEVLVVETATGGRRLAFDSRNPDVGFGVAFSPDGGRLATAAGRSVLVWDVTGTGRNDLPASADAAWTDLASADAAKGFAAVRYWAARPDEALKRIAAGVSPVPAPGPKAVADLIDRLGGPDFADREAAEKSVEAVADTARVELRAAVAGAGPEVRRRLGAVLERTDPGHPLAGDRLRAVRAVEVLERVGSAEARRVLDGLAAGAPGARLTDEARAAVGRLGRQ